VRPSSFRPPPGGGGDIFRDRERMNRLLAYPAHVYRVDVLFDKKMFAE
jgi:hypothetical protein